MRRAPVGLPRPDPSLHQTGTEGFDGNRGVNELRLLEHFGMRSSSDLLDVGCGIGRLAYECASYLDEGATYTGMDIAPVVIDWLNANYAPQLDGFRFDLIDAHSERYRPDGSEGPEQVRFPYDDATFDVACAFEVFMHLSLEGVQNYLEEMARVLRPGGLAVVTLVAIYPGEKLRNNNRDYVEIAEGVHTLFPRRRTVSMAYDLDLFRPLLTAAGLDEIGHVPGRMHSRLEQRRQEQRQRREEHLAASLAVRRARRRPQIDAWLAEGGPKALEALASRMSTPSAPPPEERAEVEVEVEAAAPLPPHACDLFAARKQLPS